ncbi:flavodoxin family protein [Candidatus Bathyarchaeota archaeon]|nr:flavodoxin family protein [Candidatus Bathyarchaeota archaeon]
MRSKRLLIVYYSGTGNTRKMAEEIGEGARSVGVNVEILRAEECNVEDLASADGVVIGSPTYFSNVAWQVKKLIDGSISLYGSRRLKGKVGGCFTSSGTRRDGEECIRMIELAFGYHHGMRMIPGIIRASGDDEEKVSRICREYGERIAKRILKE